MMVTLSINNNDVFAKIRLLINITESMKFLKIVVTKYFFTGKTGRANNVMNSDLLLRMRDLSTQLELPSYTNNTIKLSRIQILVTRDLSYSAYFLHMSIHFETEMTIR